MILKKRKILQKQNVLLLFLTVLLFGITWKISENQDFFRGILGLGFFIFVAYCCSNRRKHISWRLVLQSVLMQLAITLLVLKVPLLGIIFQHISEGFVQIIGYSKKGTHFLLASFGSGELESPLINFASVVLPSILFFSVLTNILYYYGIIQKVVHLLAIFAQRILGISGAESLTVAANIFLGHTEAGLLIRHYLPTMNRSEIFLFMTSGMATVSGAVMATYIYFLGGDDPVQQAFFAKHFMIASFISAPAAVLMAKMLVPQEEKVENDQLSLDKSKDKETNILPTIADGTADGLRFAVNIAAMLLVVVSLLAMINSFFLEGIFGKYLGLNALISHYTAYPSLSMQFIFAYLLAPFVYMMGVHTDDILAVAQLIGEKTVLNEFIAYDSLGKMKVAGVLLHRKSIIIATYVLCGFSNFSSVGIQIAGIGTLVPSKRKMLSEMGFKALLSASLACILTGIIAGILVE